MNSVVAGRRFVKDELEELLQQGDNRQTVGTGLGGSEKGRPMIVLRDIARIVGVSTATVSRALRDFNDISPVTRARIRQVAREIGYLQPPAHREHRRKRIIGIICEPMPRPGSRWVLFARGVIDGLHRQAYKEGYACLFLSGEKGEQEISYMAMARHVNLMGICIIHADFFSPQLQDVLHGEIPVAALEPFGMPEVLEIGKEAADWGMIISAGTRHPCETENDAELMKRQAEYLGGAILEKLMQVSERGHGEMIRPVFIRGAILKTELSEQM